MTKRTRISAIGKLVVSIQCPQHHQSREYYFDAVNHPSWEPGMSCKPKYGLACDADELWKDQWSWGLWIYPHSVRNIKSWKMLTLDDVYDKVNKAYGEYMKDEDKEEEWDAYERARERERSSDLL